MALGALGMDLDTNAAIMLCATYHLSAFTSSREESTTPQWETADLFLDISVFTKVGGMTTKMTHSLGVFHLSRTFADTGWAAADAVCNNRGATHVCCSALERCCRAAVQMGMATV